MCAILYRAFFQAACDVQAPEEKFNVDEYSDMVTLSKPVIYISIEEIINTHSVRPRGHLVKSCFIIINIVKKEPPTDQTVPPPPLSQPMK